MIEQIGPYEITRELGRGGMGVVYLAREYMRTIFPDRIRVIRDRVSRLGR